MADEVYKPPENIAVEFPLTVPIKAYGEEVKVIRMRKPTGADLVRVGNPVNFYPYADPVKVEHDMSKVVAMAARLSNIPSASIEMMDSNDLIGMAWAMSPFFIPVA